MNGLVRVMVFAAPLVLMAGQARGEDVAIEGTVLAVDPVDMSIKIAVSEDDSGTNFVCLTLKRIENGEASAKSKRSSSLR